MPSRTSSPSPTPLRDSTADGVQVEPGKNYEVSANAICISLPPSFDSDAAISRFLFRERRCPIAIVAEHRALIVRDLADVGIDALLARVSELRELLGDPEAVNVCPLSSSRSAASPGRRR
ncbi:MAG: hypothetical protein IPK26_09315 [Planctomycetes bacterium]|nr:hypothetical protein [Planctomycetota bacterium]